MPKMNRRGFLGRLFAGAAGAAATVVASKVPATQKSGAWPPDDMCENWDLCDGSSCHGPCYDGGGDSLPYVIKQETLPGGLEVTMYGPPIKIRGDVDPL